jgi:hypothetical protein
MNLLKNIISLLLIFLIASSALPLYQVEDASHDGLVDLEDAILQVQDFTRSADSSVAFSLRFEKMLNTFSSVAGLKKLIAPNKENKSAKHQASIVIAPDKITNSFSIHLPPKLTCLEDYPEYLVSYESRHLDPSSPPPRIS